MKLPSPLPQIDEIYSPREAGSCLMPQQNQPSVQNQWQYLLPQQPQQQQGQPSLTGHELQEFLTSTDPTRTGIPGAFPCKDPRSFGVPDTTAGLLRMPQNAKFITTAGLSEGLTGLDPLHSQMSFKPLSAENPEANMQMHKRDTWHSFSHPSEAAKNVIVVGDNGSKYSIATGLNSHINPGGVKIENLEDDLPRPSSMPSLGTTGQFMADAGLIGEGGGHGPAPTRRKGRGGRTAAMDPRLDPSIDPKRAKRILANRQSAARSKNKQRGHLDTLQGTQTVLAHQKTALLKEVAWLRSEVQSMQEESSKLESQISVLREHSVLQEALQIKLLEECGQSFSISDAVVGNET